MGCINPIFYNFFWRSYANDNGMVPMFLCIQLMLVGEQLPIVLRVLQHRSVTASESLLSSTSTRSQSQSLLWSNKNNKKKMIVLNASLAPIYPTFVRHISSPSPTNVGPITTPSTPVLHTAPTSLPFPVATPTSLVAPSTPQRAITTTAPTPTPTSTRTPLQRGGYSTPASNGRGGGRGGGRSGSRVGASPSPDVNLLPPQLPSVIPEVSQCYHRDV
jgi:hypothetical protein